MPSIRSWPQGSVLAVYLILAALCTRPLLELRQTHIAGYPGDPVLNASILWWNATTVPFSDKWWDPPYFYPTKGVSAFTENLAGISPVATPLYWITRSPIVTYNITLFLTWPLSAFAVYLLVRFLARRDDAAFIAGLAYGFSPYRTAEMGHIQMVASFWIPLALLGLHGYLRQRRVAWLLVFGLGWLLQSLANGYLMVYGGVLIALWLLYFGCDRESWRAVPPIMAAWVVASLPLVPVMLKYRAIHEFNGLHRDLSDVVSYSVPVRGWLETTDFVWLWRQVLPDGKDDLFPGATALVLVLVAVFVSLRRVGAESRPARHVRLVRLLAAATTISVAAAAVVLWHGPWRIEMGRVVIRMGEIDRALTMALLCGVMLVVLNDRVRAVLARRSTFRFYMLATFVMAILSCGPVIPARHAVVFDHTPYYWLMFVPGFRELRVPSRFWMLGILCLAVAAGLAFARLSFARRSARTVVFLCASAGLLLDGWLHAMPMTLAPERRALVERPDSSEPVLELPLGPEWDPPATFRSMWHRRGVFNGVSGYEPLHYLPLEEGLTARDPAILLGLSSFGAFEVVVDAAADPQGEWTHYVAAFPGAVRVLDDGTHILYRVPAGSLTGPVGPALPIVRASAYRGDATAICDGRADTVWFDSPQRPYQWISVDLGAVTQVGGVAHGLGKCGAGFPRRLAIDVSIDGRRWDEIWEGSTVGYAFRATALAPMAAVMRFTFPARPARFVRLRQVGRHRYPWCVAELQIHEPPG